MEATVETKALVTALRVVKRAVNTSAYQPIFRCVKLGAEQGTPVATGSIRLVATDLRHTVTQDVTAEDTRAGEIAVDFKTLDSAVGKLKKGTKFLRLSSQEDSQKLKISAVANTSDMLPSVDESRVSLLLNTERVEDFPEMPNMRSELNFFIPLGTLADMYRRVLPMASIDMTRQVLMGIEHELMDKGTLRLVATNGRTLIILGQANESITQNYSANVPAKFIKQIIALGTKSRKGADVQMFFGKEYVMAETAGTQIISHLIPGPYPKYMDAVTVVCENKVVFDVTVLREIVKNISGVLMPAWPAVALNVRKDTARIVGYSQDLGRAESDVPIVHLSGEPVRMLVNYQYLLDILNAVRTKYICVKVRNNTSAVLCSQSDAVGQEQGDYISLIMPMIHSEQYWNSYFPTD